MWIEEPVLVRPLFSYGGEDTKAWIGMVQYGLRWDDLVIATAAPQAR